MKNFLGTILGIILGVVVAATGFVVVFTTTVPPLGSLLILLGLGLLVLIAAKNSPTDDY